MAYFQYKVRLSECTYKAHVVTDLPTPQSQAYSYFFPSFAPATYAQPPSTCQTIACQTIAVYPSKRPPYHPTPNLASSFWAIIFFFLPP